MAKLVQPARSAIRTNSSSSCHWRSSRRMRMTMRELQLFNFLQVTTWKRSLAVHKLAMQAVGILEQASRRRPAARVNPWRALSLTLAGFLWARYPVHISGGGPVSLVRVFHSRFLTD